MSKRHWKKKCCWWPNTSLFSSASCEKEPYASMPLFLSLLLWVKIRWPQKQHQQVIHFPPNKKREGLLVAKKLLHITQFRALSSCGNSLTSSSIFLNCSFTEAWRKKFGRKCESFLPGKKICRPFQEFHWILDNQSLALHCWSSRRKFPGFFLEKLV